MSPRLVAIAVAYASDRTTQRGIWLAAFFCLAVIGFAILHGARANVRYMAVYFVTVGAFPGGPGFLSWALNSECLPFYWLHPGLVTDHLVRFGRPSSPRRS